MMLRMKERGAWAIRTGLALTAALGLAIPIAVAGSGGGGNVLPAQARPHGYTLADMARAGALFTTSGNDLQYYPDTPFQVLYADTSTIDYVLTEDGTGLVETGSNTIRVPSGTMFYVPILNITDSNPIIGTYPTDHQSALAYFYDPAELGAEGFEVVVDGKTTPLNESYLAGPVTTPSLLDGTHILTVGAFLTPLSVGTHTVTIRGTFAGALIPGATGGFATSGVEFTYTVQVVPGR